MDQAPGRDLDWISAAATLKAAAAECAPFDAHATETAVAALARLARASEEGETEGKLAVGGGMDWDAIRAFIAARAGREAKNWDSTAVSARLMRDVLGSPKDAAFRHIVEWVLTGGNWGGAVRAAREQSGAAGPADGADARPWAVLVMGTNGIRKTTSIHQPWFRQALRFALGDTVDANTTLPDGSNSFFRQLDYMIATLAHNEFARLYQGSPCDDTNDTRAYSAFKDALFARYRTLAESLGVLLLGAAGEMGLNVMVETSGRDIASFHYIDRFCPWARNLRLRFSINDISLAEASVDRRMAREMEQGRAAVAACKPARDILRVNAGGPYGASVLRSVQVQSHKVWQEVQTGKARGDPAYVDWHLASLEITASATDEWTLQAVAPDGRKRSQAFRFERIPAAGSSTNKK